MSGSNITGSSNTGVYGTLGVPADGNHPGGREWATSWTDGTGNFWLFGGSGYDSKGTWGSLNDFWEYSPTTNQWVWRGGSNTAWWFSANAEYGTLGTPAVGNIPGSRYSALNWTDSGGNLWLFGGEGYDAKGNLGYLNDLWEFNPTKNLWAWMGGSSTLGASGFYPGNYGTLGTAAPGNTPGSRIEAVGWTDASGNLWLFGGFGWDAGGHPGYLNDLWKFSPSTNQWAWMGGSSTVPSLCNSNGVWCGQSGTYGTLGEYGAPNVPGGRSEATGWADASGHLWLFGGTGFDSNGNPGSLNDLWEFNPSVNEWMWMGGSNLIGSNGGRPGTYGTLGIPDGVNNPGARIEATSWIDGNGHFWIFGGYGYSANGCCGHLNDLWEFDPSTNQWAWMGGSSNDFNQPGTYGAIGAPNSANNPGGRTTASGWTDSKGNLWLFGGEAYDTNGKSGELDDLWRYQLSTAILPQAATPTFSLASGTYSTTQTVTISDATPGATTYYTTDGTVPTTTSIVYSGPVLVSSTETLEAVATATSYSPSAIATKAYVITTPGQAPSPTTTVLTSSLNPSEFGQQVTFTAQVSGQSGGIASGTVTFSNGGTTLGSAPLNNSSAILTTSKLPQSMDLITAMYSGDSNFVGSISNTVYQAVSDEAGASNMWTWMGGSSTVESSGGQSGVYGISGIPAANNIPGSREGATSWSASNGHVWLFGGWGFDGGGGDYLLNELWEFNPSTNQWTWRGGSSVIGYNGHNGVYGTLGSPAASDIPGSRQNAAGWTDQKGNFWLFGGVGNDSEYNGGYLNDLWEFNASTVTWTWMSGASLLNKMSDDDYGQPGIYGTLGLPAKDNIPGGRQEASSWTDSSGNLWLFGGKGFDINGNLGELNDFWEFKPSTNEWVWVGGSSVAGGSAVFGNIGTPAAGNIPGSCSGASNWTDSIGRFWLLGCNAFWKFAPSTSQWTLMGGFGSTDWGTLGVPSTGNFPGSRQNAASWTDSSGNLWLFGGDGTDAARNTGALNDLWAFNVSRNEWAWMGGSSTVPDYSGQPGVYGTLGVPTAGNIPGGRSGAMQWTDNSGNLWLFGGSGWLNPTFDDLWKFQPPAFPISAVVMPAFSEPSGTYTSAQTVSLSDSTTGATIYYTTDGSTPTVTPSEKYTTPLTIGQTTTVSAIAAASGYSNSAVASATYTINLPPAATPAIKPAGGTFTSVQNVSITDATKNATIYYTTDGSAPSATNGAVYKSAITVSQTTTINAVAAASGYSNSSVAFSTYVINLPTAGTPVIKPTGGTYTAAQTVTITDATKGAAIYYTTDGSTPSATHGTKYTSAIPVKATETINAIAVATNDNPSALATATYTLHLPQTITFTQPTSPVTYGAKPITLSATSNSGLPVTLSLVTGPATLNSNSLTITGAGSVVVAANQPGNATYTAATQVTKTITVNKATLTATATKQSMTYGGPLPSLTYTLTGFVNGDTQATATTGAPAVSTTAKVTSPVGSYPIAITAGTLAAANYTFKFTASTLTVSKTGLTVTANNLTMKQGAAVPALTYKVTGLVNGDTQAKAATGAPKLSTTATSKSALGSYPITAVAGTLASTNYSFAFVNATMTVTK